MGEAVSDPLLADVALDYVLMVNSFQKLNATETNTRSASHQSVSHSNACHMEASEVPITSTPSCVEEVSHIVLSIIDSSSYYIYSVSHTMEVTVVMLPLRTPQRAYPLRKQVMYQLHLLLLASRR